MVKLNGLEIAVLQKNLYEEFPRVPGNILQVIRTTGTIFKVKALTTDGRITDQRINLFGLYFASFIVIQLAQYAISKLGEGPFGRGQPRLEIVKWKNPRSSPKKLTSMA